jgi:hypothetical protein
MQAEGAEGECCHGRGGPRGKVGWFCLDPSAERHDPGLTYHARIPHIDCLKKGSTPPVSPGAGGRNKSNPPLHSSRNHLRTQAQRPHGHTHTAAATHARQILPLEGAVATADPAAAAADADVVYLVAADSAGPNSPPRWAPARPWQAEFISACERELAAAAASDPAAAGVGAQARRLVRGPYTYVYAASPRTGARWLTNATTSTSRRVMRVPLPEVVRLRP